MSFGDVTAESAAKLWGRAITVPISTTGASGDATIHSTTSGLRFVVFYLVVASSAGVDLTLKSGATAISGAMPIAAGAEKTWGASMVPVLKGRAASDAFVINASAATNLRGFALVAEMQP